MKEIITDLFGERNDILNSNDLEIEVKEIYIIYSLLDALINKVSEEDVKKYFTFNKSYITLSELAEIYKLSYWSQNPGFHGVFFERFVYNIMAIRTYEPLNSFILKCLSRLDIYVRGDEFNFILWGTEKGKFLSDYALNLTLNVICEEDIISIGNNYCKFKDILKKLYHTNKDYNGLAKADLFVKFKNSRQWFGVDVKLNVEDFSQSNRSVLPIRIALKSNKIKRIQNQILGDKVDDFTFIFPKEKDYGELAMRYFRYIILLLDQILKNNRNKNIFIPEMYEFNTYITLFLLEHKNRSVFEILRYFETILRDKGIKCPQRIIIHNTCNTLLMNNQDCSLLDNNIFNQNKVEIG